MYDGNAPKTPRFSTANGIGKLKDSATLLIQLAYGLDGLERIDHARLIPEAAKICHCSERAVKALLYGYTKKLQKKRRLQIFYV